MTLVVSGYHFRKMWRSVLAVAPGGGGCCSPVHREGLTVSCFLLSSSVQLTVDTLQFLLFLFIQQLNHVSLRTSLIGEEWPSHRTRSAAPSDREAKASSQSKVSVRADGSLASVCPLVESRRCPSSAKHLHDVFRLSFTPP